MISFVPELADPMSGCGDSDCTTFSVAACFVQESESPNGGSLYYFLEGCVLNIYDATKLVHLTYESILFVLASDCSAAINATTFLQAQSIFSMQSRIINNDTLMIIPKSDVPLFFNNNSLVSEQNISLS